MTTASSVTYRLRQPNNHHNAFANFVDDCLALVSSDPSYSEEIVHEEVDPCDGSVIHTWSEMRDHALDDVVDFYTGEMLDGGRGLVLLAADRYPDSVEVDADPVQLWLGGIPSAAIRYVLAASGG